MSHLWSTIDSLLVMIFFICLLFLDPMSAYAEEKNINFKQQINLLKTAKKATVYISNRPYSGSINIESVKHNHCRFVAKEVKNVEDLIEILKRAELKMISNSKSHLPVIGMVIELVLNDGSTMGFAFGREYLNENIVDGELILPSKLNNISLLANSHVHRDLYNWIRGAEVPVTANPEKWQLIENCEFTKSKGWFRDEKSYQACVSVRQGLVQDEVNQCLAIKNKFFYRENIGQGCAQSEFYRPTPNVCLTGWN